MAMINPFAQQQSHGGSIDLSYQQHFRAVANPFAANVAGGYVSPGAPSPTPVKRVHGLVVNVINQSHGPSTPLFSAVKRIFDVSPEFFNEMSKVDMVSPQAGDLTCARMFCRRPMPAFVDSPLLCLCRASRRRQCLRSGSSSRMSSPFLPPRAPQPVTLGVRGRCSTVFCARWASSTRLPLRRPRTRFCATGASPMWAPTK